MRHLGEFDVGKFLFCAVVSLLDGPRLSHLSLKDLIIASIVTRKLPLSSASLRVSVTSFRFGSHGKVPSLREAGIVIK
jgi:hypothetical protein